MHESSLILTFVLRSKTKGNKGATNQNSTFESSFSPWCFGALVQYYVTCLVVFLFRAQRSVCRRLGNSFLSLGHPTKQLYTTSFFFYLQNWPNSVLWKVATSTNKSHTSRWGALSSVPFLFHFWCDIWSRGGSLVPCRPLLGDDTPPAPPQLYLVNTRAV